MGIEITASAIRLAALSGRGGNRGLLFTKTANLPAGTMSESYARENVRDAGRLEDALRECLSEAPAVDFQRGALSLPDGVFRTQIFEFDELPGRAADRERLIRWRLEKSAFDISDTVLRHQVLRRRDKGFSVLACAAKQTVLSQYEAVLAGAGIEPWAVGLSSFHTLNFYSSYLSKASPASALAHVSEDSFTTIITEAGGARFYRYKEVKGGGAGGTTARLMREIEESLHFYTHADRTRQATVGRLYLTGDAAASPGLAEGLRDMTSLDVEVLSPSVVLPSAAAAGPETAAALGAAGDAL